MKDINGENNGFIGISEDITERKRAEKEIQKINDKLEKRVEHRTQELKASEEKYKVFIENSSEGYVITDKDMNIIDGKPIMELKQNLIELKTRYFPYATVNKHKDYSQGLT